MSLLLLVGCQSEADKEERMLLRKQHRFEAKERQARVDERLSSQAQLAEQNRLQHKYLRFSTVELKMMYSKYSEKSSSSDRVVEIERELRRRWKAGDADAQLPQFEDSSVPAASK